jgi:gliding motility-associated lipoprotein GldH
MNQRHHPISRPAIDHCSPGQAMLTMMLSVMIILALSSCNQDVLYDNTKRIPDNVWDQGEKVRFEVPVEETGNTYRFYLNIRHTTDYRYSNLYLFINSVFPDGNKARDTVECILARPDGKWLGKGITGIRDNQLLLRTALRFPEKGTYIFEFEQAMREGSLEGITDIGLRIERN